MRKTAQYSMNKNDHILSEKPGIKFANLAYNVTKSQILEKDVLDMKF